VAVKVVIVDDHDAFRANLRELLMLESFDVVGDAATGAAGVALAAALRPDLVVLDVMLPDGAAFDLVPSLHRSGSAVVLISTRDRRDYGDRVTTCGAEGFLGKSELTGPALRELLS
jgi:DNA-binding NarL/FixJ family response regulator